MSKDPTLREIMRDLTALEGPRLREARVQVVSERVVYSAHASELGIAPAGTKAASSSPAK